MFISHKYKLIYLEVPRTGSRAVTKALTELDPDSVTVLKRKEKGQSAGYHHFGNPELDDDSFTVIAAKRNPYDRLWSFWKHRHRHGNPRLFHSINWQQYLDWAHDTSSVPEITGANLDIPIAEMFDLKRVDFWLEFERLSESWDDLAKEFNYPLPTLTVQNASPDQGEYFAAYNKENAAKVAERFSEDFEFFNYSIDSWQKSFNR